MVSVIAGRFGGKLGRFGLVGLLSTLLYGAVAVIGNNWTTLGGEAVNIIAFCTSSIWSYAGHYHITFRSDAAHRSSLVKFFALCGAGFGISSAIVVVNDRLGLPRNLATAIVAAILPVTNFLVMQLWVFTRRRAVPASRHD
jgi:putative flippase GtrA